MPKPINLGRPQETRGSHLDKRLIWVGGLILVGVAVYVMLPSDHHDPKSGERRPSSTIARMVKESTALQKMRGTYNGDAMDGAKPEPPIVTAMAPPDRSEEERLRKENAQLKGLLNRMPQAPSQPAPVASTQVNAEAAKRAAEERKKIEQMDRKLIVRKASASKDRSNDVVQVTHPLTPYSLAPSWKIPCITVGPVSNDVPGSFEVRVRQPVWDTATGQHVVIPPQASIVASPRGKAVLYGDGRLGIDMHTLTFPDASSVKLTHTTVTDHAGQAGFSDQVDRRGWSLLASIVIYPLLRSGTSLIPGGSYGDPASALGRHVASETATQGQKATQQFLRTEPILLTRPGYACTIFLEQHLNLERSWPLS